jgi:hypothetical protein
MGDGHISLSRRVGHASRDAKLRLERWGKITRPSWSELKTSCFPRSPGLTDMVPAAVQRGSFDWLVSVFL